MAASDLQQINHTRVTYGQTCTIFATAVSFENIKFSLMAILIASRCSPNCNLQ